MLSKPIIVAVLIILVFAACNPSQQSTNKNASIHPQANSSQQPLTNSPKEEPFEFKPFNKNNLKANIKLTNGERYTWTGIVQNLEEKRVLIFYEKDKKGNETIIYAELKGVDFPPRGTEVTFDGVLKSAFPLSLTDRDGKSMTANYLGLEDCHIH